jgi:hypothetical protein
MNDIATLAPAAERVAEFPLISREAIFGNPTKAGGQISRDGQWLGWMAPHNGSDERLARAREATRQRQAR